MTDHTHQPDPDETAHRDRIVAGLVDLAAFLEANPAVPVPDFQWRLSVPSGISVNATTDLQQRAEIDRIAGLLGVAVLDQSANGGHYIARRHFGPITYEAVHVPAQRMAEFDAMRSYETNIAAGLDGNAA